MHTDDSNRKTTESFLPVDDMILRDLKSRDEYSDHSAGSDLLNVTIISETAHKQLEASCQGTWRRARHGQRFPEGQIDSGRTNKRARIGF
jgi:hypothetical protein